MAFIDQSQLGPQFRFWALHVAGTATPSFVLALKVFNSPGAVMGMLAGVATFVCGYSLLCSTNFYRNLSGTTVLGRSVKIGTKIRLWLSLATAPFLLTGWFDLQLCMLAPDFWAGWGAFLVVATLFGVLGIEEGGAQAYETDQGFLTTYSITVVEGLIISFTLVGLVFFTLLYQNRKANRMGGQVG